MRLKRERKRQRINYLKHDLNKYQGKNNNCHQYDDFFLPVIGFEVHDVLIIYTKVKFKQKILPNKHRRHIFSEFFLYLKIAKTLVTLCIEL